MEGRELPADFYFMGKCDQKGFTGKGFGEVKIKIQSDTLPEQPGELYRSCLGKSARPGEGIYELLRFKLIDPAKGEVWPRWEDVADLLDDSHVAVESLGRVELLQETSARTEAGDKVIQTYTFVVSAQVSTKTADDFDKLMRDDSDDNAVRARRLLALTLAGECRGMLALRDVQPDMFPEA